MGSLTEIVAAAASIGVAGPLVVYPAYLAARARVAPSPWASRGQSPVDVSVVMAVRDEEPRVADKLAELLRQEEAHTIREVLVVDDGSRDGTVAAAGSIGDPRVVVIRSRGVGKAAALGEGLQQVRGGIVLFCDARQRLEPGALAALLRPFGDPAVGVVSGSLSQPSEVGPGLYWRYERAVRASESRTGSVIGATGAFYAVRRELAVAPPVGALLDDVLIPMEAARRGGRVVLAEDARVVDDEATLAGELARKARTITGTWQLLALAPWLLDPRRNPLWARFAAHKLARLLLPLALAALVTSQLVLFTESRWHAVAALAQLGGWTAAALAGLGVPLGPVGRWARAFAVLQAAAVLGAWRFARGDLRWTRAQPGGGGLWSSR